MCDDQPGVAYSLDTGANIICCGCTSTGRETDRRSSHFAHTTASPVDGLAWAASTVQPDTGRFAPQGFNQFRAPTIARQKPL